MQTKYIANKNIKKIERHRIALLIPALLIIGIALRNNTTWY
jgi:hypothetical protein